MFEGTLRKSKSPVRENLEVSSMTPFQLLKLDVLNQIIKQIDPRLLASRNCKTQPASRQISSEHPLKERASPQWDLESETARKGEGKVFVGQVISNPVDKHPFVQGSS